MAYERVPGAFLHAGYAGADLSAKLYYFAKQDTDEKFVLAGAGERPFGVIKEGDIADRPVTVQYGGISKAICGGNIAAGASLGVDTDGKAVTYASGVRVGKALQAGVANAIIAVQLDLE